MGRIAVIAAALTGLTAFGGAPATRTYTDAHFGFVVSYPAAFHVGILDYTSQPPNQILQGAAFGNVRNPQRLSHLPPANLGRKAVVLVVMRSTGGPPLLLPATGRDTGLPLLRSSFEVMGPAGFLGTTFVANGWFLRAEVWIGSQVSRTDRNALWKMVVRSLHMRPLHTGQTTGEAPYRVLLRTTAYPVVSVTPVGQTFLVHALHGFYTLGLQTGSCALTFTVTPVAFACPDGRQWDRVGRPLWPGASPNGDELAFAPTLVSGDGHVLVATAATIAGAAVADDVERQTWG